MRFTITTTLPLLTTLLASTSLATPNPNPIPNPIAESLVESIDVSINPDAGLAKRADNWCYAITNLKCRKGPGTQHPVVKVEGRDYISPEKNFGVRCTHEGTNIHGEKTWDYIPGWNCWVSAYYTRSAGPQKYCETGLSECRKD